MRNAAAMATPWRGSLRIPRAQMKKLSEQKMTGLKVYVRCCLGILYSFRMEKMPRIERK
jgi:hypothetical protein